MNHSHFNKVLSDTCRTVAEWGIRSNDLFESCWFAPIYKLASLVIPLSLFQIHLDTHRYKLFYWLTWTEFYYGEITMIKNQNRWKMAKHSRHEMIISPWKTDLGKLEIDFLFFPHTLNGSMRMLQNWSPTVAKNGLLVFTARPNFTNASTLTSNYNSVAMK